MQSVLSVIDFCKQQGFTQSQVRWWLFNREHNGLVAARAVVSIGRRVYIDVAGFHRWIERQGGSGMNAAPAFDLEARRAERPRDTRAVLDCMADGVSALDAQVRSQPFHRLTEGRIAAIERNLALLRGLCSELRVHVTATEKAQP